MITISNLKKTFSSKSNKVDAVKDVSLKIGKGEIYGIIGYSGAGKSTLVRCINFLETPNEGTIEIEGAKPFTAKKGKLFVEKGGKTKKAREKDLNALRKNIGMIFQHFNLLDRSTVFDNIAYPLRYSGKKKKQIYEKVVELLKLVGLEDKINAYPSQLSGGQKQRVAIARALANDPKILLSDEATSALDPDATESVLQLLKTLNEKLGLTIVIITHEMSVIKTICHKVAVMENGEVVEQGSVYDIFAHPKAPITKKFVSSTSGLGKADKLIEEKSSLVNTEDGARLVKLQFGRSCVGDALISQISRDFNVNVNIVLASVEVLQNDPLGGMIAKITGEPRKVKDALYFLLDNNVKVEVL